MITLLATVCAALSLVGYTMVTLARVPTVAGVLDGLALLTFFAVAAAIAAYGGQRHRGLAALVLGLCWLPVAVFYFGNALYFRYYRDDMPFHVVFEASALKEIPDAVWAMAHGADFFFLLLVPLLCGAAAVRSCAAPPSRRGMALLVITAIVLGGRAVYAPHDPFFKFLAGVNEYLGESRQFSESWFARLAAKRSQLFPLTGTDYAYAPIEEGVFLQDPRPDLPPPKPRFPGAPAKANVVVVLLESFRAFESGAYGAEPSFTPQFDALARESLLCTAAYANGFQTVRGEFTVLASLYPNVAGGPHYIHHPRVRLRSLPTILKEAGYRTSWLCGIGREFERHGDFLAAHDIDEIVDRHLLPTTPRIGMGLSDEALMEEAVERFDAMAEPFFSTVLTLSNHYPFYEYPTDDKAPPVEGSEVYQRYARGIYYTDHAIGHFMALARRRPWYERTLFVFCADHGLYVFPDQLIDAPLRQIEAAFRIPLLFHASWLPKGRCEFVVSQLDVAPTVLDMLGLRPSHTFLGRSVVDDRLPAERRIAVFCQQRNWFIRRGDNYLYCGLPRREQVRQMEFMGGYQWSFSEEQCAQGFSTTSDLLRQRPRGGTVLDPAGVRQVRAVAREALDLCKLAVVHDAVYRRDESAKGVTVVASVAVTSGTAAVTVAAIHRLLADGADYVLVEHPGSDALVPLLRAVRGRLIVEVASEAQIAEVATAIERAGTAPSATQLLVRSAELKPSPGGLKYWCTGSVDSMGADCLGLIVAGSVEYELLRRTQSLGRQVMVSEVTTTPQIEALLFLGVDGLVTELPAVAATMIGHKRHLRQGHMPSLGQLVPLVDGRVFEVCRRGTGQWRLWRYQAAGQGRPLELLSRGRRQQWQQGERSFTRLADGSLFERPVVESEPCLRWCRMGEGGQGEAIGWPGQRHTGLVALHDGSLLEWQRDTGQWWLWSYLPEGEGRFEERFEERHRGRWSTPVPAKLLAFAGGRIMGYGGAEERFRLWYYYPHHERSPFGFAPYAEGKLSLADGAQLTAMVDGQCLLHWPESGRWELRPTFP